MNKNKVFDFLIFIFCFSIVIGGAYNIYVHFDFSYSVDSKSYMKMSLGDFDVTVTHRYRVIIPYLAGLLADALDLIYPIIWHTRGGHEWAVRLAYFVLNSFLLGFTGMLLFKICLFHGVSLLSASIGVLAFLTSRWAFYVAGLPLIDSLYLLVIAAFVYGLLTDNQWFIGFSLLVGPLAKESFFLFLPLIFYFNRKHFIITIVACLLGLLFFFGVRNHINTIYTFSNPITSFQNAINHAENVSYSLSRIFSLKGVAEIFFTFGIFNLLVLYHYLGEKVNYKISIILISLLPVVLIHILLSGDVGRMLYISAPYFCTGIALGAEKAYVTYYLMMKNA